MPNRLLRSEIDRIQSVASLFRAHSESFREISVGMALFGLSSDLLNLRSSDITLFESHTYLNV